MRTPPRYRPIASDAYIKITSRLRREYTAISITSLITARVRREISHPLARERKAGPVFEEITQ